MIDYDIEYKSTYYKKKSINSNNVNNINSNCKQMKFNYSINLNNKKTSNSNCKTNSKKDISFIKSNSLQKNFNKTNKLKLDIKNTIGYSLIKTEYSNKTKKFYTNNNNKESVSNYLIKDIDYLRNKDYFSLKSEIKCNSKNKRTRTPLIPKKTSNKFNNKQYNLTSNIHSKNLSCNVMYKQSSLLLKSIKGLNKTANSITNSCIYDNSTSIFEYNTERNFYFRPPKSLIKLKNKNESKNLDLNSNSNILNNNNYICNDSMLIYNNNETNNYSFSSNIKNISQFSSNCFNDYDIDITKQPLISKERYAKRYSINSFNLNQDDTFKNNLICMCNQNGKLINSAIIIQKNLRGYLLRKKLESTILYLNNLNRLLLKINKIIKLNSIKIFISNLINQHKFKKPIVYEKPYINKFFKNNNVKKEISVKSSHIRIISNTGGNFCKNSIHENINSLNSIATIEELNNQIIYGKSIKKNILYKDNNNNLNKLNNPIKNLKKDSFFINIKANHYKLNKLTKLHFKKSINDKLHNEYNIEYRNNRHKHDYTITNSTQFLKKLSFHNLNKLNSTVFIKRFNSSNNLLSKLHVNNSFISLIDRNTKETYIKLINGVYIYNKNKATNKKMLIFKNFFKWKNKLKIYLNYKKYIKCFLLIIKNILKSYKKILFFVIKNNQFANIRNFINIKNSKKSFDNLKSLFKKFNIIIINKNIVKFNILYIFRRIVIKYFNIFLFKRSNTLKKLILEIFSRLNNKHNLKVFRVFNNWKNITKLVFIINKYLFNQLTIAFKLFNVYIKKKFLFNIILELKQYEFDIHKTIILNKYNIIRTNSFSIFNLKYVFNELIDSKTVVNTNRFQILNYSNIITKRKFSEYILSLSKGIEIIYNTIVNKKINTGSLNMHYINTINFNNTCYRSTKIINKKNKINNYSVVNYFSKKHSTSYYNKCVNNSSNTFYLYKSDSNTRLFTYLKMLFFKNLNLYKHKLYKFNKIVNNKINVFLFNKEHLQNNICLRFAFSLWNLKCKYIYNNTHIKFKVFKNMHNSLIIKKLKIRYYFFKYIIIINKLSSKENTFKINLSNIHFEKNIHKLQSYKRQFFNFLLNVINYKIIYTNNNNNKQLSNYYNYKKTVIFCFKTLICTVVHNNKLYFLNKLKLHTSNLYFNNNTIYLRSKIFLNILSKIIHKINLNTFQIMVYKLVFPFKDYINFSKKIDYNKKISIKNVFSYRYILPSNLHRMLLSILLKKEEKKIIIINNKIKTAFYKTIIILQKKTYLNNVMNAYNILFLCKILKHKINNHVLVFKRYFFMKLNNKKLLNTNYLSYGFYINSLLNKKNNKLLNIAFKSFKDYNKCCFKKIQVCFTINVTINSDKEKKRLNENTKIKSLESLIIKYTYKLNNYNRSKIKNSLIKLYIYLISKFYSKNSYISNNNKLNSHTIKLIKLCKLIYKNNFNKSLLIKQIYLKRYINTIRKIIKNKIYFICIINNLLNVNVLKHIKKYFSLWSKTTKNQYVCIVNTNSFEIKNKISLQNELLENKTSKSSEKFKIRKYTNNENENEKKYVYYFLKLYHNLYKIILSKRNNVYNIIKHHLNIKSNN